MATQWCTLSVVILHVYRSILVGARKDPERKLICGIFRYFAYTVYYKFVRIIATETFSLVPVVRFPSVRVLHRCKKNVQIKIKKYKT